MSNIKLDDLAPAPHVARCLDGQSSRNLTTEEMQTLRGGAAMPTEPPPVQGALETCKVPGMDDLWRLVNEAPGWPLAWKLPIAPYPSDKGGGVY